MIVRKLRLQRGWSQDQLAEFAGVSVRTIQRVERGQKPSLETSKALAAVFEVDLSTFTSEDKAMDNPIVDQSTNLPPENYKKVKLQPDEEEAMNYAKGIKEFLSSVLVYVVLALAFAFAGFNEPKVYWVFGGLGIGVIVQGLMAYEIIRFPWQTFERKLIEKRLGRKL